MMGIGKLGNPNIMVKRKWRWLLEIQDDHGNVIVPKDFVKISSRPNIDLEEIDFLNQKSFVPGRLNSNDTTITYYEYEQSDGACHLTKWLAKHMPPDGNINLISVPKANYILHLLDGCGVEMESWTLFDGILTSISFGDDYSNECVSLELNVKYTKIHYKSSAAWSDGIGTHESSFATDEWKMPDEWVIRNPIVTVSSSPGERTLDQFLRRMASK